MTRISVFLVSVLAILPASLAIVELQSFFPYGTAAGDLRVPTADDNFVEVDLTGGNLFHFFNVTYDKLFVNNNGGVSFVRGVPEFTPNCGPSNVPMIIPYWADVNTMLGGNVFYRESTDANLLAQATQEVHRSFPGIRNFNTNWLFIATWDDAPFFGATTQCDGLSLRNQFQTILVTDGTKSFAMFYFNQITWTTGTASGGTCTGTGGTPAKSGFDLGDGVTFFQLPGSCTADIMNVTSTSNVDQEGKWIFRIDQTFEEAPEEVSELPEEETSAQPEEIIEETSVQPEIIIEEECDVNDCQHVGHCYQYSACNHMTRSWEHMACSPGLYWNPPHRANNTNEDCTASCDIWDNLPEETKASYQADEACFSPCFYKETADCSGNYMFHSHKSDNRDVKLETCPVDTRLGRNVPLVWVQQRETCDFCYNAVDSNGMACCAKYDDVDVIEATTVLPESATTFGASTDFFETATDVSGQAGRAGTSWPSAQSTDWAAWYSTTRAPAHWSATSFAPANWYQTSGAPYQYYSTGYPYQYYSTGVPYQYYQTSGAPYQYYQTSGAPYQYYSSTRAPPQWSATSFAPANWYQTSRAPSQYYQTSGAPYQYYSTNGAPAQANSNRTPAQSGTTPAWG